MEQSGKYLVSKIEQGGQPLIVSAFYENGKAVELSCTDPKSGRLLGNIYVGKVKNILSNIEAAFIEIADGILCYYSLRKKEAPVFLHRGKSGKLTPGDELLVQVSKEAVKTKAPTATGNLTFPGKYLVLSTGKKSLGLSNKLPAEERERLQAIMKPYLTEDYGIIVRTNAAGAGEETLREELTRLDAACRKVLSCGTHYTSFSLVYQEPPAYALEIRNLPEDRLSEIVTDDPEIFSELQRFLMERQPEDLEKLRLYEETRPSLDAVYGISRDLEHALQERVWLKSGAYLVIQPTEALTVIDVNTGKFEGHKKPQETFRKINREAAAEIARQIRLRNLSGIIVVDFIDMEESADQEGLMEFLGKELKKDPVKTVLVDMTPLGLVEITRKKVKRTLLEQVKNP